MEIDNLNYSLKNIPTWIQNKKVCITNRWTKYFREGLD